jgi:hypothetical protein
MLLAMFSVLSFNQFYGDTMNVIEMKISDRKEMAPIGMPQYF